jgi:hypothetical protein
MSYTTYKLMHFLGLFAIMVALAGIAAHAAAGHGKEENRSYKVLLFLHGAGALLALTGGFGLLARLNLTDHWPLPGWIWGKLTLWVLLGGLVALPYRRPAMARTLLFLLPVLGFLGAVLASFRPF